MHINIRRLNIQWYMKTQWIIQQLSLIRITHINPYGSSGGDQASRNSE